ncbi:MAG: hypothetical protein ACOY3D_04730 [Candidatus Omnitrophota bacterium]
MKSAKIILTGKMIEIKGSLRRHQIAKEVVNTFIKTEYRKKGKGIGFKYPVEEMPAGRLFISRPGHKKNFDFKVEVTEDFALGEGSHIQIAKDLKNKKRQNKKQFPALLDAITEIYHCSESDVDKVLNKYPTLPTAFKKGAAV